MKGQDSDTFKAEVVQHLLTLQVSHPQLREAIQEVCCQYSHHACTASELACLQTEHTHIQHMWHQCCIDAYPASPLELCSGESACSIGMQISWLHMLLMSCCTLPAYAVPCYPVHLAADPFICLFFDYTQKKTAPPCATKLYRGPRVWHHLLSVTCTGHELAHSIWFPNGRENRALLCVLVMSVLVACRWAEWISCWSWLRLV